MDLSWHWGDSHFRIGLHQKAHPYRPLGVWILRFRNVSKHSGNTAIFSCRRNTRE
jgi:hypothetical protein